MNFTEVILWGFVATIVLTTVMAIAKPMGLTRMDLPFLLGTVFTPNRSRAAVYGFALHLVIGWLFAFLYAFIFRSSSLATTAFGVLVGFVHAAFVLSVGLQIVASLHPRMAHPFQGPTPTRLLQPPGFFALNYGRGTPAATIIAHMVYGGLLGTFLN
jgi:hypothetical protein